MSERDDKKIDAAPTPDSGDESGGKTSRRTSSSTSTSTSKNKRSKPNLAPGQSVHLKAEVTDIGTGSSGCCSYVRTELDCDGQKLVLTNAIPLRAGNRRQRMAEVGDEIEFDAEVSGPAEGGAVALLRVSKARLQNGS